MNAPDNKTIVRRFIEEVVNQGNLAAMEQYVDRNMVDHNAPADAPRGIEAFSQHLAGVRRTYGDFHLTIERQFAEGDVVVTWVTATGIHRHEWFGLAPTGRRIALAAVNIDLVVGGKIVEHWGIADTLSALLQMGAQIAPSTDAQYVSV